jgi:SsrA-binding protein
MSLPKSRQIISQNRRARFDYFIEEVIEAGIVLMGSELKSLRQSKASISESFAADEKGELYLINSYIEAYTSASHFGHESRRHRKLLLKRRELNKLLGAVQRKGITIVPISIYFNEKGRVKVELGIAKGKRQVDKRATEKDRDWQRQKSRIMKDHG